MLQGRPAAVEAGRRLYHPLAVSTLFSAGAGALNARGGPNRRPGRRCVDRLVLARPAQKRRPRLNLPVARPATNAQLACLLSASRKSRGILPLRRYRPNGVRQVAASGPVPVEVVAFGKPVHLGRGACLSPSGESPDLCRRSVRQTGAIALGRGTGVLSASAVLSTVTPRGGRPPALCRPFSGSAGAACAGGTDQPGAPWTWSRNWQKSAWRR